MLRRNEPRPSVWESRNVVFAVLVHAAVFAALYFSGNLRREDKVEAMPFTVVLQENLNGVDDEPPPTKPPEPEPPKPEPPKPEPPKPEPPKPEPPKPPPEPPPDAVVQTPEPPKTNKVEKVAVEEPPKPKPKTREERLAEMREKTTKEVKVDKPKPPPQPNGRTGPKTLSDEEIRRLLAAGAKVGAVESIPKDETSRCIAAIANAIELKWKQINPQVGASGTVHLNLTLGSGGAVKTCSIAQSCGDPVSDNAALKVVKSLTYIPGLSAAFLREHSEITILHEVKGNR